ncbi:MAG: hypothetical protein M1292_12625, partial [Bacteroidetes bacterium]|nr:hypothetical protein [Bacteroidota bacterium]
LPDAEKDGNIVTKPKNRSKRRFFIRIEIFPKINILSSTSEFTTYFIGPINLTGVHAQLFAFAPCSG